MSPAESHNPAAPVLQYQQEFAVERLDNGHTRITVLSRRGKLIPQAIVILAIAIGMALFAWLSPAVFPIRMMVFLPLVCVFAVLAPVILLMQPKEHTTIWEAGPNFLSVDGYVVGDRVRRTWSAEEIRSIWVDHDQALFVETPRGGMQFMVGAQPAYLHQTRDEILRAMSARH